MTIRAVFFDLDGTLIDSMPAHVIAWQTVLRDIGMEMDELFIKLNEGERAEDTLARLAKDSHLAVTMDGLRALLDKKRQLYRSMAPHGLIPEARKLVDELLRRGVECDIVTGSIRANMDGVVPPEEVALFKRIITPDDYTQGKPDADPYLTALRLCGFAAEECLVLENAPLGVQSGKAAGLYTLAITTTLPDDYLIEADRVIHSYEELLTSL
jgi:beta-phosphoglucomutase